MSQIITLSVIIVNWNVKHLLADCLRSLIALNMPLLELYVVDNHSSDGSVELIKREFPEVKLIENQENVGFARANNQAIRQAQGKYVLLLNPDTLPVDDSIQKMVRFMDEHSEIGVLGPKLLNADQQSIQYWGARKFPHPLDVFFEYTKLSQLFPHHRLFSKQLIGHWDHTDSREVECLSGACMLIRRETWQSVGLLDEAYPLYWEDTDWCRRAALAGFPIYYWAEAQIVHLGGQSSLQNRGPAMVMTVRGMYRYFGKFHQMRDLLQLWLLLWLASVVKLLVWALIALFKSSDRDLAFEQMKAYWAICRLSPFADRISKTI